MALAGTLVAPPPCRPSSTDPTLCVQILGVAVVAAAGYVLGFNGDFDSVSPSFMTYLALGTGIVIILIAILACCATCNYTKKWAKVVLVVYSFLMFVVMAIIVCSGALVWMKRDELRGCEYVKRAAVPGDACVLCLCWLVGVRCTASRTSLRRASVLPKVANRAPC